MCDIRSKPRLNSEIASGDRLFHCSFGRGKWGLSEWLLVKSPRWERVGDWDQKDECIENQVPAGVIASQMQDVYASQTYTSMVLKQRFFGGVSISSTMEFSGRMAPLIVISKELGEDNKGRAEYRGHYEIVLFDKGVNIWRHYFENSKPWWEKAAYGRFPLKANVRYKLEVEITPGPNGARVSVRVENHEFGYLDETLPDEFYVGITGCEGVNRFYDFEVRKSDRVINTLETE